MSTLPSASRTDDDVSAIAPSGVMMTGENGAAAAAEGAGVEPKEDLSLLVDRTPPWLRWPAGSFAIALLIGFIYWVYSVTPLQSSDLWAHVAYGEWTAANGIPRTEPLMPLCDGMPMPAVDWLWDLAAYGVADAIGPQGLKFFVAGPIAIAMTFLGWSMYRRNWSATWTIVGIAACVWMLHKQLFIRPQLAGLAIFCVVWFLAREGRRWRAIVGVGLLFALWSNVHGSWPVGFGLLGAMTLGRAVDLLRRTGSIKSLWHDQRVRTLLLMCEVAAIAVLIHPDGWRVYPGVWSIVTDTNVEALVEWQPLTLRMKQGQALAAVSAVLILLYRVSPRRASFSEALTMLPLAAATLMTSRYIVWLAPLVAYYLALHGAATWRGWRGRSLTAPASKGLWAAASIGIVWIAFALAPQYRALTGNERPLFDNLPALSPRVVSDDTPVNALAYLREHPPAGLVYNDLAFGDALLWFGPEGTEPFVHSHAHLTPKAVWSDYFAIRRGTSSLRKLDRYGVTDAFLHASRGRDLARELVESGDWQTVYRDRLTILLKRITPIGVSGGSQDENATDLSDAAGDGASTANETPPEPPLDSA